MRICFDIDGVIFKITNDYNNVIPIKNTIERINRLKEEGNTIILYTARKMQTYKGNIGLVNKCIAEKTLEALREHNVLYDEIYFGKPSADYYIDDKAINFYNWEAAMPIEKSVKQEINLGIITYRLDEMERSLERNMEKISEKIDALLEEHKNTQISQSELKVKVNALEDEVKSLKEAESKVKDDLNSVKVNIAEKMGWGVLGGGLVSIIAKLLEEGVK